MANLFTRALDFITPWNRVGEVQRRQERKKKEEEDRQRRFTGTPVRTSVGPGRVSQESSSNQQKPQLPETQRPENLFKDLNQNLLIGRPKNVVDVTANNETTPVKPQPGDVVAPEKPKQSFLNKARDILDANTEADKYRRVTQEATKINQDLVNKGVNRAKARETALKIAQSNNSGDGYRSTADDIRDATRDQAYNFLLKPLKSVVANPIESGRALTGQVTGNKAAEEAANRRNTQNLYSKEAVQKTDKGEKLGWLDLAGATGDVLSVLPILKGAKLAGLGIKEAALARSARPVGSGILAGLDEVTFGLRNLFKRPKVGKEVQDVLDEASKGPKTIPVEQKIPISSVDEVSNIPVNRVETPKGPIIREVGGDARAITPDVAVQQTADDARKVLADSINKTARPDVKVGGVVPQRFVDVAGVTRKQIEEERSALDQALASKEINKTQHKAANKELDSIVEAVDKPSTTGKKIEVKTPDTIPVRDETVVPTNLPETPGEVRTTTATAPNNAKSVAIATQTPAPILPPETQTILDNPRQFTKRQVEAARNQRKMARQVAKAQQETSTALEQINAAETSGLSTRQPGLVQSGEFRKGRNGAYQKVTQADQAEAAAIDAANKSARQVIDEARASVQSGGRATAQDVANIENLLDSGRVQRGTPEYIELSKLYHESGTANAQELALRNKSIRRTGSGQQISNQAVSKLYALSEDPTKIKGSDIARIDETATRFADLRDAATKAQDDFLANATKENYDNFMELSSKAQKAEKDMAIAQFDVSKRVLKGNTNIKLRRMIEDAADQADLSSMDFVDASLLSSTGTFTRNFINAGLGSAEEGLFGGIGSKVGSVVADAPVGGGVGRGSIRGFKEGFSNLVDASKARFKNAGWNPLEHMKNWSTTGNELGDSFIEGSVGRSVRNQYEKMLKAEGYTGEELRMRADVMTRQDPQDLASRLYAPKARTAAGLGSGVSKRSSFEKSAQRGIADKVAKVMGKEYSQGGESVAKGVTRIVFGFPSAIARSIAAGAERVVPFANLDTVKAITANSPEARALAIKESIKKSGSAATVSTVFGLLGANGQISGSYPQDPDEQARWEREGIKENSIKIGDAWYDIPSYMGSFGVPALMAAAVGRNGGVNAETLNDMRSIIGSISPTDGLNRINDVLDGKYDFGKYTQNVVASAARMATPYGSLLNQLSKVFDPNQHDTEGDTWVEGTLNKVMEGIPFLDQRLPDKTDSEGNPLYNPSTIETLIGSNGAVQKGGVERSQQISQEITDQVSTIDKYGLLSDSNLDGVLEGKGLEAFNKLKKGKNLDESDAKALKEGLVKGVSQEGTDTAYLEREQYDTNLAVLKLKRDIMNADPTVKPSSLEDIDIAIKRGEVYKQNKIPYDLISDYQKISVEDWRKMGDPEEDEYDPEMYQMLWSIDEIMTKAGVSYRKGKLDKQKYYEKEKKGKGGRGGKGRGGGSALSSDFGKLKAGDFAPSVQAYQTIDQQSGGIPVIRRVRPNIVHKISASG